MECANHDTIYWYTWLRYIDAPAPFSKYTLSHRSIIIIGRHLHPFHHFHHKNDYNYHACHCFWYQTHNQCGRVLWCRFTRVPYNSVWNQGNRHTQLVNIWKCKWKKIAMDRWKSVPFTFLSFLASIISSIMICKWSSGAEHVAHCGGEFVRWTAAFWHSNSAEYFRSY